MVIRWKYHTSSDCFIFTLISSQSKIPAKFPLKIFNENAVYHNAVYGPCFGKDIYIDKSDFLNNNCSSSFPSSYQDVLGKRKSIFTGNNEKKNFKIKEIEVFKMYNK